MAIPDPKFRAYWKTEFTGGGVDALDGIDTEPVAGTILPFGSLAIVVSGDYLYFYNFTASTAAEAPPDIISPDNAMTVEGRWLLVSMEYTLLFEDMITEVVSVTDTVDSTGTFSVPVRGELVSAQTSHIISSGSYVGEFLTANESDFIQEDAEFGTDFVNDSVTLHEDQVLDGSIDIVRYDYAHSSGVRTAGTERPCQNFIIVVLKNYISWKPRECPVGQLEYPADLASTTVSMVPTTPDDHLPTITDDGLCAIFGDYLYEDSKVEEGRVAVVRWDGIEGHPAEVAYLPNPNPSRYAQFGIECWGDENRIMVTSLDQAETYCFEGTWDNWTLTQTISPNLGSYGKMRGADTFMCLGTPTTVTTFDVWVFTTLWEFSHTISLTLLMSIIDLRWLGLDNNILTINYYSGDYYKRYWVFENEQFDLIPTVTLVDNEDHLEPRHTALNYDNCLAICIEDLDFIYDNVGGVRFYALNIEARTLTFIQQESATSGNNTLTGSFASRWFGEELREYYIAGYYWWGKYMVTAGFSSSYPIGDYYFTTTDLSNVDISGEIGIYDMTFYSVTPDLTAIKGLISFDSRVTWLKWDGNSFGVHSIGDAVNGNTLDDLAIGCESHDITAETTLDFCFCLEKSVGGVVDETPVMQSFLISYISGATGKKVDINREEFRIEPATRTLTRKATTGINFAEINIRWS